MKKIGKVLHVSAQNRIIVRSDKNIAQTNADVIDKELKRIGKIFDIFGTTRKPYVSIIPSKPNILEKIKEGDILYLRDEKPSKSKKRSFQDRKKTPRTRRKRFDRNTKKST